jgi:hypothetical protein
MHEDQTTEKRRDSRKPAGGGIKRLFDSPYLIDSPEEPADLSHIGNGRGPLIDEEVERLIKQAPAPSKVKHKP